MGNRMKWQVIGWLVLGLLVGGSKAWAQVPAHPDAEHDHWCVDRIVTIPQYSFDAWLQLTQEEMAAACQQARLAQMSVPVIQRRSDNLARTGAVFVIIGLIFQIPHGDTVNVLGDDYCVDTYSVEAGGCYRTPLERKIGFALIGAGVPMIMIGRQQVGIHPVITPTQKSITTTIKWGGKK